MSGTASAMGAQDLRPVRCQSMAPTLDQEGQRPLTFDTAHLYFRWLCIAAVPSTCVARV
jgi:hypothetical protein